MVKKGIYRKLFFSRELTNRANIVEYIAICKVFVLIYILCFALCILFAFAFALQLLLYIYLGEPRNNWNEQKKYRVNDANDGRMR